MSAQYMQPMIFPQQYQGPPQLVPQGTATISQIPQVPQNSEPIVAPPTPSSANSAEEILSISTDFKENEKHTQFLSIMIDLNKAFRIPCSMVKSFDETIELNKQYTQTNQDSNMNVIFMNLTVRLRLHLRDLAEVGFRGLFMKTANNNDIILQH
jgi:hypothetical protein